MIARPTVWAVVAFIVVEMLLLKGAPLNRYVPACKTGPFIFCKR